MHLKIRTKDIALIAIYAALYAALVVVLGPFSYGPIQIRIADSLLAVVPLLGLAGVLGHTLGVFVANIFSTAGPIDLLNTVPSFAMSFVVYYVYKRTKNDYTVIGTCIAYSAVLGITVGWMLSFLYRTTTSSHHSLRCYWKYYCKRAYRMANFQVAKEEPAYSKDGSENMRNLQLNRRQKK